MNKYAVGVLINDIHLDKSNGSLVKDIFQQLMKVCEEYNTNRIFCGGDVFTNRSGQPLQCLTDWKEILEILTKKGFEFYVIPGNHDKTDSNSERIYHEFFGDKFVHLYRSSGRILLGGCVIGFIPYFQDEKWLEEFQRLEDEIDDNLREGDIQPDCATILITHLGFDGVVYNDGSRVSSVI